MIIKTTQQNGCTVATINAAEASLQNSEAFKSAVISLIDEGNHNIIINFEQVDYLDSSFLGALVSSLKYSMQKQATLCISNLKKDIYALLELTRIDKVFRIYKTTSEAFEAYEVSK